MPRWSRASGPIGNTPAAKRHEGAHLHPTPVCLATEMLQTKEMNSEQSEIANNAVNSEWVQQIDNNEMDSTALE